uniref:Izumo sperm-egg fusion protein 4 isoform X9 n=1 Tax=Geotrypetes seraphini TaxID=260995 RepID=A0A6P8S422_GEOSA|nr:izumo sperm-egg fusion protein 4 isoform X9 [Geotrypetes seraphini]
MLPAQDKLRSVAKKVYEKIDSVYKEFMYKPGVFPQILSSVLKAQTLMLRDEIIERIYKYDTISCITCNASVTICFGYNCGTSEEWELALDSLPKYIKLMSLGFKTPLIPSSQNTTRLTSFSGKFEKDRIFWDKEKVPFKVTYMTCTVA